MNRKIERKLLQFMSWMKSISILFCKFISRKKMNNEIGDDFNEFDSNRNSVPVITASILALSLTAGCISSPYESTLGDIPKNTQLAISPNGSRLLVSWNDRSGKLHAKLVELKGSDVASTRDIALPEDTLTTAFAKSNEQLLLTTWDKKSSSLLKINLGKDNSELIYKSQFLMRFPLEVSEGNYVFLEGRDAENRFSHWQRYQQGQKNLLNNKSYSMASDLNVVGDALFLLEPWMPPAFRNLYGALPVGLSVLIDKTTFNIKCADHNPLICLRTHLLFEKIRINDGAKEIDGFSYATMEVINDQHRCGIAGHWIDSREINISRDGNTVVFHVAIENRDGPRAIYIVKNTDIGCAVNAISIKGK